MFILNGLRGGDFNVFEGGAEKVNKCLLFNELDRNFRFLER